MALPKYDEIYPYLLTCLSDGTSHTAKELQGQVAALMGVTDEERKQMLPSGRQPVFSNRFGWAATYLKKAGLIESPSRGVYILTDAGKHALSVPPHEINNHFLEQYDSFLEFNGKLASSSESASTILSESKQTPQNTLDLAYAEIKEALADEVLSEVLKQSPSFFEMLVVTLLEKMGYGGSQEDPGTVVGQTGDEGIDGIIREDKLGFNSIYIQAKRWERDKTVGRPEIQKFVGALAGQGANKGLFITTAQFTKEARIYAEKQHTTKVVLVDGTMLAKLMIEYDLGVSTEAVYKLKHLDTDFFNADIE